MNLDDLLGAHYAASVLSKGNAVQTMQALKDAVAADRAGAQKVLDEVEGIVSARGDTACVVTTFRRNALKQALS